MAIQFDNTNTGVATLKPASTGTITLTLPSTTGAADQPLVTDGSGTLSWAANVRASNGIFVNAATVTSDYTIATGDNGFSAGPVAVASGITVTVSSGSVWTVV